MFGSKTNNDNNFRNIVDVAGDKLLKTVRPYLKIQNKIKKTGEIFFDIRDIAGEDDIKAYNNQLDRWERNEGYEININSGLVSINSYEKTTLSILSKLLDIKISEKIAFTGEITLKGNILKVGALKEKLIAAYNAGIEKVYIPEDNGIDLKDIPKQILENVEIKLINNFDVIYEDIFKEEFEKSNTI